jgi:hypothetical protein
MEVCHYVFDSYFGLLLCISKLYVHRLICKKNLHAYNNFNTKQEIPSNIRVPPPPHTINYTQNSTPRKITTDEPGYWGLVAKHLTPNKINTKKSTDPFLKLAP